MEIFKLNLNLTEVLFIQRRSYLSWEVLNAHEIEIDPIDKKLDIKGVLGISIDEDTKFSMAKKQRHRSEKSVFVRVLKIKEIHFDVEVLDPAINEYIALSSTTSDQELQVVYLGQKVKISWDIKMLGKLLESGLGNLPLWILRV